MSTPDPTSRPCDRPDLRAVPSPVVTRLVPRPVRPAPSGTAGPSGHGTGSVQGTLALDLGSLPAPVTREPVRAPAPLASRAPDTVDRELRAWTARFAQALVEVVGGHRSVTQLVRWTSREVYRDLERRTQLLARATTPIDASVPLRSATRAQVRSVHVSRPSAQVAEVSVHVRQGARSRALALRLDLVQGRWVCTALEFS